MKFNTERGKGEKILYVFYATIWLFFTNEQNGHFSFICVCVSYS